MSGSASMGARLRDARLAAGLNQRKAAKAAGIHFTHLSKVESGHENPSDDLVRRLCALYHVDPEPLLEERWMMMVERRLPEGYRVVPGHFTAQTLRDAQALTELEPGLYVGRAREGWVVRNKAHDLVARGATPEAAIAAAQTNGSSAAR